MVISMLAIGTLSLILFIIIEWRVAKLPMMPGKYHPLSVRPMAAPILLADPREQSRYTGTQSSP